MWRSVVFWKKGVLSYTAEKTSKTTFFISYLCELWFSWITDINFKMKGRLIGIEAIIFGSLSYVRPDVREVIKKYEAQVSY